MNPRTRLRAELRARRRDLDPDTRADAAFAIAHHVSAWLARTRCPRIAAYCAADGEADPGPAMAAARALRRTLYLPVLDPLRAGGMAFVRTEAGDPLHPNRFGIPEPQGGEAVRAAFLDLVLVPLVAYDGTGHRLGMGAGYYDRCFAFRHARGAWCKPRLIGVAFDFQEVDHIEARAWDVALDGIVTESGMRTFT